LLERYAKITLNQKKFYTLTSQKEAREKSHYQDMQERGTGYLIWNPLTKSFSNK
jgi:hypothetical protein